MRPKTMTASVALITAVSAVLDPANVDAGSTPEKYAVLVATEETTVATEADTALTCADLEDIPNNSDFWHDLVLTYCTLKESGFKPENIFVLYGGRDDFADSCIPYYKPPYCGGSASPQERITDFALKSANGIVKDNICNVLCCLVSGVPAEMKDGVCHCATSAGSGLGGFSCTTPKNVPKLGDGDFLFVWVKGHGTAETGDPCRVGLAPTNTLEKTTEKYLMDSELAELLKELAPDRRALAFETCHCGGFLDDLENDQSVVITGAGGHEDSPPDCAGSPLWAYYAEYDDSTAQIAQIPHGRFTYWVNAALRQLERTTEIPSDTDNNNLVSIQEAYELTRKGLCAENEKDNAEGGLAQNVADICGWEPELVVDVDGIGKGQYAAISDKGGIAPCIFIRLPQPGNDADFFSMDHAHDNGTVPSNSEPWYHGPDLWVRNSADGVAVHQEPIYGQTNYVYARVHNIGCLVNTASVDFSWVEPTGWAHQSMWNPIGTATVAGLAVGSSQTVGVPWTGGPVPGSYCLHATLGAVDDPPNPDGRAYWDNNKVQINVSVVSMPAGVFAGWWLWVANWSNESPSVDLSIDPRGLTPGTRVRVELPPDVRLLALRGARLSLSPDGWSLLELEVPKTRGLAVTARPALARILLAPRARRRAIVSVALPAGTDVRTTGVLRVEERVANEVKGGVDFVARAVTLQDDACDLVRTALPVLQELARRSALVEGAPQVGEARRAPVRQLGCAYKKELSALVSRMAALEPSIGRRLSPEALDYADRYRTAGLNARRAAARNDWHAALAAAREQFLFATIMLAEMRRP